MGSPRSLVRYTPTGAFAELMMGACFTLSASDHTRKAYWCDARHWLKFCEERDVVPTSASAVAVGMWVEQMKRDGGAPKSRVRRLSALSSIYDKLRRDGKIEHNPFSIESGPKRESALALEPTQCATPIDVRALLKTCDDSPEGVRDAAIIRVLWATGARRSSITSMTFERLSKHGPSYEARLYAKGGKDVRVLIGGHSAEALANWLSYLENRNIRSGAVWRSINGTVFNEKHLWGTIRRRAHLAGVKGPLTPHMFRVAFLTINPANLDAKQDAAGHASPETTRLYDRNWRGRAAFEAMPEIEDASDDR